MPERFGDLVAIFMSALAVGYVVWEIERRRRKMYDIWDVLDEEDALLTQSLEDMGLGFFGAKEVDITYPYPGMRIGEISIQRQRVLTFGDALRGALGQDVDKSQQRVAKRVVRDRRQRFG